MNIKPLGDRIVVEALEQEDKTAGGIIIPDTAKEKPRQGKVLAVGPGAKDENGKRIPMDLEVGDIVLFTQWAGSDIKVDGKEYKVLKESDVIGTIEQTSSKKKAA
ncbi:MAG: co-chaperone GroES [Alphaproteobacteria bacterium]|jgi:chaperonin GroES|nr:co-chaperone GroES [Alphaproteobacteria bacterium]